MSEQSDDLYSDDGNVAAAAYHQSLHVYSHWEPTPVLRWHYGRLEQLWKFLSTTGVNTGEWRVVPRAEDLRRSSHEAKAA